MRAKHKLKTSFCIAFFFLIFGPVFFPWLRLLYFAPFLVLCYYKYGRFKALVVSFLCGLIIDLFSSFPFFGINAMNYSFVSLVLYKQTRNFFEDKPFTLPFMTAFFSFLSTFFAMLLLKFYGQPFNLSMKWVVSDLICMPIVDGVYGFLFFWLPFELMHKLKKPKYTE